MIHEIQLLTLDKQADNLVFTRGAAVSLTSESTNPYVDCRQLPMHLFVILKVSRLKLSQL